MNNMVKFTRTLYNELLRNLFKLVIEEYNVDLDEEIVCWYKTGAELKLPKDEYALLRGKDILLSCRYRSGIGQVFTTAPRSYRGRLKNTLELDLEHIQSNSIFHAVMNAVLKYLGLIDKTEHCVGEEPRLCGYLLSRKLLSDYGQTVKVLHIGYQPGHVEALAQFFHDNLIVTDLADQFIWQKRYGRLIVDGVLNKYFIAQADVILITASSIVNNTAWEIINQARILGKKIIVYGVSASAAVYLLKSRRIVDIQQYCPYAK